MRILLIYPDIKVHVNYPLGLGIISSVLKQQGHETKILHFNEEIESPFDLNRLDESIAEFTPELIAFSSTSNQFQYVKMMAEHIKRQGDIPILLGGIHATISSEQVLSLPYIDFIIRGEGEDAICELVEKLAKGEKVSGIQNLGLQENGIIKLNPLRPLINAERLDKLPFADRLGFNYPEILRKKKGWANLMASRGCLNKCRYCVNHYFHKIYSPHHKTAENLRYRKVDTVLREIEGMIETYSPDIQLINFDDDNITLKSDWLEEFCEEYAKRIKLPFACNVHPAQFDLRRAKMLAQAGCVEVKMGIESGSARLRKEMLKRPAKEEIMVKAFTAAEEAGLRAWSFNMVGVPTETREEMLMTAAINGKLRPYIVRLSIFFPYEGTELYEYAQEHNMIKEERAEQVSSHLEDSVLDMPQLPHDEIVRFKTMFKWYVDSYSDIEAAPLYKELVRTFEKLPMDVWVNGKGPELVKKVDHEIDMALREMKMDHYATRQHLDLNFTKKLNFELP